VNTETLNRTVEMDVPPEAEAGGHCGGHKNTSTQQVGNRADWADLLSAEQYYGAGAARSRNFWRGTGAVPQWVLAPSQAGRILYLKIFLFRAVKKEKYNLFIVRNVQRF
jgi:hypothetical protein